MSRTILPFAVEDMSALARALHRELSKSDETPGHVQLLNMLSRSAGYQNFQHFRAQFAAIDRLAAPIAVAEPVDFVRLERLLRFFDQLGRLTRWPKKASQRLSCLWVLWSRLPAGTVMSEAVVNDRLNDNHLFGDHALLRRELVDLGLVTRTPDGREYRRVEQRPPVDAVALIRHLSPRLRQ